jgi:hypothetical protein
MYLSPSSGVGVLSAEQSSSLLLTFVQSFLVLDPAGTYDHIFVEIHDHYMLRNAASSSGDRRGRSFKIGITSVAP